MTNEQLAILLRGYANELYNATIETRDALGELSCFDELEMKAVDFGFGLTKTKTPTCISRLYELHRQLYRSINILERNPQGDEVIA